jgi:hypothetical protein
MAEYFSARGVDDNLAAFIEVCYLAWIDRFGFSIWGTLGSIFSMFCEESTATWPLSAALDVDVLGGWVYICVFCMC